MSVFITSDPHLCHKNISNFRHYVSNSQENTEMFVADWKNRITKRSLVYILGDAAFEEEGLDILASLPGDKILIKGNHDDMVSTRRQLDVFKEIHGMLRYKGFWLTHCPIHPDELRGKRANIHGHVHNKSVRLPGSEDLDTRYFNACTDILWPKYGSMFVTLDQLKALYPVPE